jgi:outer membrane protein OmpA-like peptidoglycan-associated protein/tetratricopeptide (TPR) repeat protein
MKYQIYYTIGLLFLLLTGALHSSAQWYDPEKVSKKAGDIYGRAFEEAQDGKYPEAIQHINEALAIDPRLVDAYLSRAGIYANLKQYQRSAQDYETSLQLDSVYSRMFLLSYSISLAGTGNFEEALAAVTRFLALPKLNEKSKAAGRYRQQCYSFALDYAQKNPIGSYVFAPQNMGDSINSKALEYFPSFTIEGTRLIFTRRENNDEDFYESRLANGRWSMATPLRDRINTNFNEGAQNISQDGQWLIFTGCGYPEGYGSCDLYIAYQTKNGGWTEPKNLGGIVNTDYWESSPSLSPDKRDLYFSSSFPEGYGGKDIFVCHRLPDGRWSRPENLGPAINTNGDEGCPFIHADNQTLYFNSNGHPGYGETDLFVAKKINDSTWTRPQNLGYPINTVDDQGSLIVSADGKTAIYASEGADTRGGLDLYSFTLRENVRPARTLWIRGKVYDNTTKQGLPSAVELTDVKQRQPASRVQTDEEGNYFITLPVGQEYAFTVNRKGYLLYSDNIALPATVPDTTFVINIPLQPITPGATVVLKNIFFDTQKTDLKPESIAELDKLVQLMRDNPKLRIQIGGHTDNVGKPPSNLLLSNNRAKAVVMYLQQKGIAITRLLAKGFGAAKPIADNRTETGRATNRRTELMVVSN